MQFSIDGETVDGAVTPNASGQVTYGPIASLAAGSHTVEATYSGTSTLRTSVGGASSPVQEVQRLQPTGTLMAVPNPSQVNQSVTFTATFTVDGSSASPGEVDFTDDGAAIAACSDVPVDDNGVAICTTAFTAARARAIVATFAQTDTYAETVARLGYVVGLIPTQTALADSPPTRCRRFRDVHRHGDERRIASNDRGRAVQRRRPAVLCAAAAVSATGTATCPATLTTDGPHPIRATYQANATYAESCQRPRPGRGADPVHDHRCDRARIRPTPGESVSLHRDRASRAGGADTDRNSQLQHRRRAMPAVTDDSRTDRAIASISVSTLAPAPSPCRCRSTAATAPMRASAGPPDHGRSTGRRRRGTLHGRRGRHRCSLSASGVDSCRPLRLGSRRRQRLRRRHRRDAVPDLGAARGPWRHRRSRRATKSPLRVTAR